MSRDPIMALALRVAALPLWGVVLLLVLASALAYLGAAYFLAGAPGYPLDDSWIHQALARSLVQEGQLAVNPGEPTTASTAPLWTALLTLGYPLGLAPFWWAHLLGGLCLGLTASAAALLVRRLFPAEPYLAPLTALLVALEWRLVWAAFSGMETLLFTALCLALLLQTLGDRPLGWRLGLLGGLATLARPEGVVLFGLTLVAGMWRVLALQPPTPSSQAWEGAQARGQFRPLPGLGGGRRSTAPAGAGYDLSVLRGALVAVLVFALTLAPVAGYNWMLLGSPLPATFYAKSAFYQQALTPVFVLGYFGRMAAFLCSGPFLLLAPGALFLLAQVLRKPLPWERRLALLLPAAWVCALILLYLVRLPYLYHHGRYLMPVLPVVLVYGVLGTAYLLRPLPFRVLARAIPLMIAGLTLVLWVNGAMVYGWDVRFITDQQVAAAHWLRRETPPDAVIATHDIGAIGYFAGRRVVDMAGLITPELTQTPRDRERILATLQQQGVTVAVIFPSWYPWLPPDPRMEQVFQAATDYAERLGGEELRAFRIHWEKIANLRDHITKK